MSLVKHHKLNYLLRNWPTGAIFTSEWLRKKYSISHQLTKKYLDSGWITRIGDGAYAKLSEKVNWISGLYALQITRGKDKIHLGGITALELSGLAHNIPLGKQKIFLFNSSNKVHPLPKWFDNLCSDINMRYLTKKLFTSNLGLESLVLDNLQINASSNERAILEMLSVIPKYINFEYAMHMMEGLQLLRPKLMQQLLELCSSIKAKRLFLYFADTLHLPCFDQLDLKKIKLGSGKRVIASGGKYIAKYKISIPNLYEHNTDIMGQSYV